MINAKALSDKRVNYRREKKKKKKKKKSPCGNRVNLSS